MKLQHSELWQTRCYVDGQWLDSSNHKEVIDPATLKPVGQVAMLDQTQIVDAIDGAQRAFSQWRALSLDARGAILRRWGELMLRHAEDLARILSQEQGKPLAESRGEIAYAASFIPWFAEEARRLYGQNIPSHIAGAHLGTVKEPVGVCALLTPWNFPSAMITRKAAAALAAGCTVLIKPAHETPFSALALAQLAHEAGFPAGVFNVVLGEPQMAMETLVKDSRVRAVSFTGSTRVGKLVLQAAAEDVKKVALELGGNAPFIVCADADLDHAVKVAVQAKYQTSGQDCCAANRIIVERSVYADFLSKFSAAVRQLRVGPATLEGVEQAADIGPLMHQAAFDSTLERVNDARHLGARCLVGGEGHVLGGLFFQPTVLADVTPQMRIYQEENFAPIAGVMPFDTLDQAVQMANDTEYGLAAYICSNRLDLIYPLIRRLDHAMVAVNGVKFTGHPIPFGGMKASGLGREGGSDGFEPFVETKYFCLHHQGQFSGEPV
ncbi:MAG: NAD-dependent succinate-semialdehyde dehydrogenase [Pseudomonas sp.]|uniref:NAD-dependent succinate-semialdehyde dehydrogenase n=1 Tax=Pseudomonas sp. TaxID=306 RepID=UPI003D6FC426